MIHPALFSLIGLQFHGQFRRMLRGGKSPFRILVFLVGAGICFTWLTLASAAALHRHADPHRVLLVMPMALLGMCIVTAVTSAGDKAIAFTPGEVDQLFPGPFTRREIVAFKFIKSTLAALLTAGILSVVMMKYAQWWPACFAAVFLTLLLIQWFSVSLLLMGQALGEAAYSRLRKFIIIGAFALLIFGVRMYISAGARGGETAINQFRASSVGQIVLAPFEPFAQLMVAQTLGGLIKWAALAAILDAGLVTLVFLLEAHYVETAMAASERRYAKIQRLRGGSILSIGVAKTAGRHLPQFPRLGGAGVIAWRQLTSAIRSSRGLLLLLVIIAIGAAPTLAGHGKQAVYLLVLVMSWLTFLCSSMLSFDFRGDVDHMESLKALPLPEWAVAAGQLFVPVLLLTIFHIVMLGIAIVILPSVRHYLIAAMVLALPFNTLLFAAENFIFLLFPSRPTAATPGDFQIMGRKFVFIVAKMIILLFAMGVAMFGEAIVWTITGKNLPISTAVAWIILAGEVVASIPLIGLAYRRFDPSIHTPA